MSRWTDEEICELVILWPTNSAMQISNRMHRPRAAICGKAKRLLKEGLLASKIANPRKRRPRRAQPPQLIMPPKPPPPVDDRLAMQPCSIHELDAGRCHWPLGQVHKVATEFCGGTPVPGHRYCRHHLGMAH